MATKKGLAKVEKSGNILDVMSKAGVEVKLTKTEIADYIAEKAQEEIKLEIESLKKRAKDIQDSVDTNLTGKYKVFADAYNSLTGKDHKFGLDYRHYNDTYSVNLGIHTAHNHGWLHGIVSVEIPKSEVPAAIIESWEMEKRVVALNNKLNTLQTKKHRVLLIEKILSGTESGKVVLGDLTKIVNKLVKE